MKTIILVIVCLLYFSPEFPAAEYKDYPEIAIEVLAPLVCKKPDWRLKTK
jgi:hypothetical protein